MDGNQGTPDNSQGQVSTPTPSQGQGTGATPGAASGQGTNQQGIGNQSQGTVPDYAQIQHQQTHFNQKITEMGQANSELRGKLEALETAQQARAQALAQALGVAPAAQEEEDVWTKLSQDPKYLEKTIQSLVKNEIQPLHQQVTNAQVKEYLLDQNSSKESLKSQLSEYLDEATITKVMDVTPYMDPALVARAQNLNSLPPGQRAQAEYEFNVGIARAFQQAGGIEALVERNIGRLISGDFPSFLRSSANVMQQRKYQVTRSPGSAAFNNGAATQPTSSGINVTSETIFV